MHVRSIRGGQRTCNLLEVTYNIVGREILTPLFYENLPPPAPDIPYSFFCQILSNFLPPFSVASNPHPTALSVVWFIWLNGWSRHIWCAILLNDMNVHMSSLRALICVLCNKMSILLRSDTCVFLLVPWFDITHKNIHHAQGM